jgi:hypothetical protein
MAKVIENLYLEVAKIKPNDHKHIMMCLKNRGRVLLKEIELRAAAESTKTEKR